MHISVLLNESITALSIKEDGIYVDCTLGYGGHSKEILKRIKGGFLYCFDQDGDAIKSADQTLQSIGNNYYIFNTNFCHITECLKQKGITKVDGIIFDLGVSSVQLDEKDRGFSYHQDAMLDMRMNQDDPVSAYDIVNNYSEQQLKQILYEYGEEKYATSIVKNIIKARENKQIKTTLELVDIIKKSVPASYARDKHPARKTFQALRIAVNRELEVLESALEQAIKLLSKDGIICVITFHSLEDRIVKRIFNKYSTLDSKLQKLPFVPERYQPILEVVNKHVIVAADQELANNKRSRSAKLRIAKRIKGD